MDEVCSAIGLAVFVPDEDGTARLYGQEAAGRPGDRCAEASGFWARTDASADLPSRSMTASVSIANFMIR